ncbi:MAG: DUF2189 domain-containing protein [Geminicoccaceae bacterium]|mgnify:CR=1 FL=1
MATQDHIRNPLEWSADQVRTAGVAIGRTGHAVRRHNEAEEAVPPRVRRIGLEDLQDALRKGMDDFAACRTDVIFICLIYPLAGLLFARAAFNYDMLPLLFPLASGFALVGPVAAIGLYEMSRRREQGATVGWADAFGVLQAPAFGAILVLGVILFGIFLLWLVTANTIYAATLGPDAPVSFGSFMDDVFSAQGGRSLMVMGIGTGFLFACVVLAISVVSFPMLLDRDVGLVTAVTTSIRAVAMNPVPMAAWGLIVAAGLVLGSLPALLGLVIVVPILGHATWHLYRKIVPR